VAERTARGDDASEATVEVLERQLREVRPLTTQESASMVSAEMLEENDMSLASLGRPRAC